MTLTTDKARWYEDSEGFWLAMRTKHRAAAAKAAQEIRDKPWDVSLEEHREKRSKDANAYFWALAGKLAAKLGISPEEVYRQYIPDVADNYVIQPVRADMLERWDRIWCAGHMGRMTRDMGPCKKTDGYHNVMCFIGSSDYKSDQMARLIDLVVSDCKEHGIETLPADKLAALKEEWHE